MTAKETFDLDDEDDEDEGGNNRVDGQATADRMRDEQIRARLAEAGIEEEEKASLKEEKVIFCYFFMKGFPKRVKLKKNNNFILMIFVLFQRKRYLEVSI